ncbi:hypothetical protein Q9233_004370 [Columba guinea]|nr:hypothetical protein Q9233_004370 [Columba guinea]
MGAMARRRKAAAAGKRGPPAALVSPASSEDEAPEEVSFGVAREAAETERKLVGEAARRAEEQAAAANTGELCGGGAAKQSEGKAQRLVKKVVQRKGARSKGNYVAVRLKDQTLEGLHQKLARDFLSTHLYGPGTNRVGANEFFSLENKKNPVRKAAVQFVDKSWGQEKKLKAARFKQRWLATQIKKQV